MVYNYIQQLTGIPWMLQAAFLAGVLLLGGGWAVRRQLAATDGGVIPDDTLTLRMTFELTVEALADLSEQTMGPEYRRWFPVVATMFIFILIANLMGLVPAFGGSTSDSNTTWAWAIISFVAYNWVGIRKHGRHYIAHFMGPTFQVGRFHVRLLAWFFFPLELVLHFARMLTLSVRLLANMFADHTVVGIWLTLIPIGIPALFMGLGVVVALLQAFVFAVLTMVYIGLALEEPH